jgi:hypothetical protein
MEPTKLEQSIAKYWDIAKDKRDPNRMQALRALAAAFQDANEAGEALVLLELALELTHPELQPNDWVESALALLPLYLDEGERRKAQGLCVQGLEIASLECIPSAIIDFNIGLAELYDDALETELRTFHIQSAIEALEPYSLGKLAKRLWNWLIAELDNHSTSEEFKLATISFLDICQTAGDIKQVMKLKFRFGKHLLATNSLAMANSYFSEAYEIAMFLGDLGVAQKCLLKMGIASAKRGDRKRAEEYLSRAAGSRGSMAEQKVAARALHALYTLRIQSGQAEAAKDLAKLNPTLEALGLAF